MSIPDHLERALKWAALGMRVFPVAFKHPLVYWKAEATTDTAQIRAWFNKWPTAEVGLALEDETAIDFDTLMAKFGVGPDWEPTWSQPTRRGEHFVYTGRARNSVKVLGPDIDTRSKGGYIVAYRDPPKSRTEFRPLPLWVTDALSIDGQPLGPDGLPVVAGASGRRDAGEIPTDLPRNVDLARDYLLALSRRRGVEVRTGERNSFLYAISREMRKYNLSSNAAAELISEIFAFGGGIEENLTALYSAFSTPHAEEGMHARHDPVELFAPEAMQLVTTQPARTRMRFKSLSELRATVQAPSWQFHEIIPARHHVLWFGGKGSLKSFMLLDLCASTVLGVESIFGVAPKERGRAIYLTYTGEGIDGLIHLRTRAWEELHKASLDDLIVLPGPRLAEIGPEGSRDYVDKLAEALDGQRCPLVAIDTVFQATAGGEKLVETGAQYTRFTDYMIERLGCSVVSAHHPPKGTDGPPPDGSKPSPFGSQDLTVSTPTIVYAWRDSAKTTNAQVLFNKDAGEPKPFHFRIDQLAGSLVLSPLTRTAHMLLVKQKDVLAPTNVATALNALNATYGMKISTETLVEALVMKGDPKRAERKEEITRGLKRLSKAELAPYCEGAGDELWWFIPGA